MAGASSKVIIVGASVRAAAWSALRAGFEPYCVDMFADRDLSRVAAARAISPVDYPEGLESALEGAPIAPWFYTGALENRPLLIERLGRHRPLWGNGPAVLRRVRSPFQVARSLHAAGLPCPAVRRSPPEAADQRRWLLKPRSSAGGRGIKFADDLGAGRPARFCYFQEYIEGESCAAVYLAPGDGTAHLLGVTRQWLDLPWLNAGPFQYCGSAGPWPLTPTLREHFLRLGKTLARDFALRGLFGVDCVVRDEVPWPVEINPRYTASMEIIEWAHRQAILAPHAQAFGFDVEDQAKDASSLDGAAGSLKTGMLAKAVFYAKRPMVLPVAGPWCDTLAEPWQPWGMPEFADIPAAGQRFLPGEPVLTMFARGQSMEECIEALQRKTKELASLDH